MDNAGSCGRQVSQWYADKALHWCPRDALTLGGSGGEPSWSALGWSLCRDVESADALDAAAADDGELGLSLGASGGDDENGVDGAMPLDACAACAMVGVV